MSFSFGSNAGAGFGTPNKPTAFGAPLTFGTPAATTTANTGFGFGTATFGQPQQQSTPAFGTSFGAPVATSAPAFGTSFGAPQASQAPTFGSAFGQTAPAAAPAFGTGFGGLATSTTTPSLFGASTSKPGGGLFGNAPSLFSTPSSQAPLFGGTQTTQATPSLFGGTTSTPSLFGATTSSAPSLFGGGGGFGTTTTATAPNLFGTTGGFGGGGGLFGGATAATSSAPLFGGFGTGTGTNFGFGGGGFKLGQPQQQQQQPQQPQQSLQDQKYQQSLASFYTINIYGDERDDILKKWNMLQACWGTGKGFYNQNQPGLEYDSCNPFYRFKAISYMVIPNVDNTDGLVKLVFNKKESEITAQKQVIINGLNSILGSKPNLTVNVLHIKATSDTECELMFSVSEKGVTGISRKIHATDLAAFLNQPTQKQQLMNAGVASVTAYVMPSKAQIAEYLKEAPTGIDEQMWKAAQADNPNTQKYLPAPLMGFSMLKKRMMCEEYETGLHRSFLEKVDKEVTELKRKQAASLALIAEQKQKFSQLQHRVLKILVKQESTRRVGLAMQPEEELLKMRLDTMQNVLSMPTQFRGKINDLMSNCQVMTAIEAAKNNEQYKIDPKVQEDVRQFLAMEQAGIAHLIKIINSDLNDLRIISEGMSQMSGNKQ